jgi:hypothetical protein
MLQAPEGCIIAFRINEDEPFHVFESDHTLSEFTRIDTLGGKLGGKLGKAQVIVTHETEDLSHAKLFTTQSVSGKSDGRFLKKATLFFINVVPVSQNLKWIEVHPKRWTQSPTLVHLEFVFPGHSEHVLGVTTTSNGFKHELTNEEAQATECKIVFPTRGPHSVSMIRIARETFL